MKIQTWFEQFEKQTKEKIEVIQFTSTSWGNHEFWNEWVSYDVLMKFEDIPVEMLNHQFDDGYGVKKAPHIVGWSPKYIFLSTEYDGSEGWAYVSRNPQPFNGWYS